MKPHLSSPKLRLKLKLKLSSLLTICASIFSTAHCTKTEATTPDGILLQVTLASDFKRALVKELRVVFDAAPGGPGLGLDAGILTTMEAGGFTFETRTATVDSDSEPEYIVRILGNPFAATSFYQVYLASPGYSSRPFSVRVNLIGRQGVLGSAVVKQLPTGELLRFAPGVKSTVSVAIACQANVSCESEGDPNRAPVLAPIASKEINLKNDRTLSIALAASDADGDTLTFSADPTVLATMGATLDGLTGLFTWTPTIAQLGVWTVAFSVSDGTLSAAQQATIRVVSTNSDPVWSPVSEQFAVEKQLVLLDLAVSDPDGEDAGALTFALDKSGLPSGADAVFDAGAGALFGTFSWTPTSADGRTAPYTVKLSARDAFDAAADLSFNIRVIDVNEAPTISAPSAVTVKAGVLATVSVVATDIDNDAVSLTADTTGFPSGNAPTWSADAGVATLTWTPREEDVRASAWTATFSATDGRGGGTVATTSLTVTAGNSSPTFTPIAAKSVVEGGLLAFQVQASDPDGETVTLSMDTTNLPQGNNALLTGTGGTQTFAWSPAVGMARSEAYKVVFTASDPQNAAATLDVFVTVNQKSPTEVADAGAGADAGPDAGADAGPDAGTDAGAEADAGTDAGADAGEDAGAVADAGPDAGEDAGVDAGPPQPPPNAVAQAEETSIAITWDASVGANFYRVSRSFTDPDAGLDAGFAVIVETAATAATDNGMNGGLVDAGLDAGVTYYYIVQASANGDAGPYGSATTTIAVTAYSLNVWTLRRFLPGFNGVAYGNGVWLAVGSSSYDTNISTDNGVSWRPAVKFGQISGGDMIAYGRLDAGVDAFVVPIRTSLDNGLTWPSGSWEANWTYGFTGVTFCDAPDIKAFLVTGYDAYSRNIWRSTNATNFTGVLSSSPNTLRGIGCDGGVCYAVGDNGQVYYSTSSCGGWTQGTTGSNQNLRAVTSTPLGFIAVGDGGTVLRKLSTDDAGDPWMGQDSGVTSTLEAVASYDGGIAAIGTSPHRVITSSDGVTWITRTLPSLGNNGTLKGIGCNDSLCTIVGTWGILLTTSDFSTWTSHSIWAGYENHLNRVAFGGSQFVAVGRNGGILTSPDGVVWTKRTSGTSQELKGITYGGLSGQERYVAVGLGGTVVVSTNGVNWTVHNASYTFYSVIFANSLYYAAGDDGVYRSTDAMTWTKSGVTGLPVGLSNIAYNGSLFLGVGGNNYCRSTDALSWTCTQITVCGGGGLEAVTWGQGKFVALGGGCSYVTPDGISWDGGAGGTTSSRDVIYVGSKFYSGSIGCAGTCWIYTSTNGVNWVSREVPMGGNNERSIAYGNGRFVMVGDKEAIISTP